VHGRPAREAGELDWGSVFFPTPDALPDLTQPWSPDCMQETLKLVLEIRRREALAARNQESLLVRPLCLRVARIGTLVLTIALFVANLGPDDPVCYR
jgi:hypothetical protein